MNKILMERFKDQKKKKVEIWQFCQAMGHQGFDPDAIGNIMAQLVIYDSRWFTVEDLILELTHPDDEFVDGWVDLFEAVLQEVGLWKRFINFFRRNS